MANTGYRRKSMTSPLQNITKLCQNTGDYEGWKVEGWLCAKWNTLKLYMIILLILFQVPKKVPEVNQIVWIVIICGYLRCNDI